MFNRSGSLAVLLSGGIALGATLLISVLDLSGQSSLLLFVTIFSLTLLVVFSALEFIIFRKVRILDELMKKVSGADATGTDKDGSRRVDLIGNIAHDLSLFAEEKQKEIELLRKREAFRKDLIADISHELKTPIFAAQGFVHTLLDGAVNEKAVRKKFLKKAAKSLDGLDMLVQDLLTLSQIETGQIRMRFQETDLYALTEDVMDQLKGKSGKKDISLRIEGAVRKVLAYADGQRISQVMTNLISNAIKHSVEGGEVVVSFSVRKKSVVTRVRDFGEGIKDEDIERIFERFYRVDKSRSREKGGTGLGLAIVKRILEGHNSFPKVESTPGAGSIFSFKLKRAAHEKNDNEERHQPATDQRIEK